MRHRRMVPYYSGLAQVRDVWKFHIVARISTVQYGDLSRDM